MGCANYIALPADEAVETLHVEALKRRPAEARYDEGERPLLHFHV